MAVIFTRDTVVGIFDSRVFRGVFHCPLLLEGSGSTGNDFAGSSMVAYHGLAPSTGNIRTIRQGRVAVCHDRHNCHLCGVERSSDIIVIRTPQD
jgi:hypothetical protein